MGLVVLLAAASVKRVGEDERGLVFRTGRLRERVLRPGTVVLVPFVDRLERVDVSETVVEVPFTGPAKDGRRVRVEAVLTFRVVDPVVAATAVQNHRTAICRLALVVLRTEVEQRTFEELATAREELRRALLREVAARRGRLERAAGPGRGAECHGRRAVGTRTEPALIGVRPRGPSRTCNSGVPDGKPRNRPTTGRVVTHARRSADRTPRPHRSLR
ncbi:SPFH domain-containing protein [Kitasatospora griseola]|uniref:SPFH domain-containing protein n=1 Tax=Kitasatospora griseola TaxID=2064 RepID=UPI00166FBBAC|nr:SPFH domain-containing protein [Kitasatospora griseola]GGQ93594.1 hypothetical protein GCM10010195_56900 [Kitasatospora griseola]